MDREKVIKGLECCITFDKTFECGTDCPYLPTCDAEVDPLDAPKCAGLQLHIDALELIKEYQHMDEKMIAKNCFTCANSFVDDDDKLHCMADGHNHEQIVGDDYSCEDWNR